MNNYTGYEQRIKKCFRAAFDFLDSHKHPREFEDFTNISIDIGKAGGEKPDPLLKDLLLACFKELEREYIFGGENKP